MVASVGQGAARQPLYSGTTAVRLSRPLHRLWVAAVVALGFACGGCSYQLGSLAAGKEAANPDQTGSIGSKGATNGSASAAQRHGAAPPPEYDLAYARAAASEALSRGGKDTSIPWENPQTGARGNITPLASAYDEGGVTCRDFLASYVRAGAEAWLQGEACRMKQGRWEVKSLRPWKQT